MHILIIPSWYKTPFQPSTGTFFEEQARMLQKRGHRVGILFPKHELRFFGIIRFRGESTPVPFEDDGIPTYYSFTQSFIPKIESPTQLDIWMCQHEAFAIYSEYKKKYGKPDLLHAHSVLFGGLVAQYISTKEEIPYFITEHFSGWCVQKKFQEKPYSTLFKKVIVGSKKAFAVSSFFKRELDEKFRIENKERIEVLHNIVSERFIQNVRVIKLASTVRLVVIANLIKSKNHLTLLKAILLLRSSDSAPSVHLNVVGGGVYNDKLKAFVKENDLEKEVEFTGIIKREKVRDILNNSHILVSASTFETFGVNIIEALAMGRPVVVYNSGGPEGIVRPQDGILFDENSPEVLAKSIQKVIDNYNDYNQNDIAKNCALLFGEEHIYQKLIRYYNDEL